MTSFVCSNEMKGTEECHDADSHQIPLVPPAPPRLKPRASPVEFQSFSMTQVEQALSSNIGGINLGGGTCPMSASCCSISSCGGCFSQNDNSSQRQHHPADLASNCGSSSIRTLCKGLEGRQATSFGQTGAKAGTQSPGDSSTCGSNQQSEFESLMEQFPSVTNIPSMSMQ